MLLMISGGAVAQLSEPVTQISAGSYHGCALSTSGGVKCWGRNDRGQLGDNSNSDRPIAVDVKGVGGVGLLSGIAAIAGGGNIIQGTGHTCALTTGGGVKCWGSNQNGQLGDNSTSDSFTPVDVVGMSTGVVAISLGSSHTCALTAGGGMKCWGNNVGGELGDNSVIQRKIPVDVFGLTSGVSAISAGAYETCALTLGGGMKCWGDNALGQLGDGSTTPSRTPVDVSGLTSGVLAIKAGNRTTCAVTATGGAKCWGDNLYGQVGDGTTFTRHTPVDVFGLTGGVVALSNNAGSEHTCALMTGGGVKCWGRNDRGQVGDNSPSIPGTHLPADVVGLQGGVIGIAVQQLSTCALSATGKPRCWGDNLVNELGDGTKIQRNTPTRLSTISTSEVAMLALGESHTCVLTLAGGVKCWGFNSDGELGNNSIAQSLVPVDPLGLTSGVAYVAAWKFHTCVVTTGGAAQCWGQNTSGSLGDGTGFDRHVPTDVVNLQTGMASVAAGPNHTCGLTTGGGALCWGANASGQLGDKSNNAQHLIPVGVFGLTSGVASISLGNTHTCALDSGGIVQCWGGGASGELGDGLLQGRNFPTPVPGLPVISALDTGGAHACVLTSAARGLECWGTNSAGELGDGTNVSPRLPGNVMGLASGMAAVSSGTVHTCAITSAGGAKCWGDNFFHELGDGSSTGRLSPVDVVGLASGVIRIEAGIGHTCALTIAGDVKCWGHNLNGQLGDNTTTSPLTPVTALVGGQSIVFTPPAKLAPGASATLSATATSGLPVTFDTWTPSTCTLVGNLVTATAQSLCGIRASQPGNANIPPAPQSLRLMSTSLVPILVSAASRKLHGGAGTFDLALSAVTINPTTEPRQGTSHTIAFTFDKPINAATVTITEGTAAAATPTFSGNDVVIGLTGVVDQQYVTISLANVASTDGGTGGNGSVRLGFLLGDVNGSRVVSLADLGLVNSQLSQVVTAANFLKDVNANGTLTLADKGITNAALTRALPPP
jgi:alpha-tubulin suppressor-like RCC1 family protein